jgi:predicted ATPase
MLNEQPVILLLAPPVFRYAYWSFKRNLVEKHILFTYIDAAKSELLQVELFANELHKEAASIHRDVIKGQCFECVIDQANGVSEILFAGLELVEIEATERKRLQANCELLEKVGSLGCRTEAKGHAAQLWGGFQHGC